MSMICAFANEEPLSFHFPKHTNNHQFSLVQILIQSCHSGGSIFPNKLMSAVFGRHCEQRLWFHVGLSGAQLILQTRQWDTNNRDGLSRQFLNLLPLLQARHSTHTLCDLGRVTLPPLV